ncbi:hypothetical protein EVAR_64585_1 [Eumeta japonica]|uniref:Uncharacterized protein n=1 Tax=Eumeta variegata TaxID=151549 RepID=A0A4C1ZK21_EUMVA|nr:hypothetical protein EVAR_64585_1 [Eumeta japonica]
MVPSNINDLTEIKDSPGDGVDRSMEGSAEEAGMAPWAGACARRAGTALSSLTEILALYSDVYDPRFKIRGHVENGPY